MIIIFGKKGLEKMIKKIVQGDIDVLLESVQNVWQRLDSLALTSGRNRVEIGELTKKVNRRRK